MRHTLRYIGVGLDARLGIGIYITGVPNNRMKIFHVFSCISRETRRQTETHYTNKVSNDGNQISHIV